MNQKVYRFFFLFNKDKKKNMEHMYGRAFDTAAPPPDRYSARMLPVQDGDARIFLLNFFCFFSGDVSSIFIYVNV